MDFLTFDDLLKTTLQVDAARRIDALHIANYGAQGDTDSVKKLMKEFMRAAYPEQADAADAGPNPGMRGLKGFLGKQGKLGKGSRK